MTIVAPLQGHFDGGEVSPLLYGRVDSDRYKSSLALCKNWIPTLQGALTRRPGSYYINAVKDSTQKTRLIPFQFSISQSYMLEFGYNSSTSSGYIRFYTNYGIIESGGVPVEVSHPYADADIFDIRFVQSADVLYLVHPNYQPMILSRNSNTSWTLSFIDFSDGPYLPININSAYTMQVLSSSGSPTSWLVQASQNTFVPTDSGRLFRMIGSGNWVWGVMTYVSATEVSVLPGPNSPAWGLFVATSEWRLGVWSQTTGYPGCVSFHEDRLALSGSTSYPQRVDFSVSDDYLNFAPTQTDGTVVDSNAMSFNLNATDVNDNVWLNSDEKGLLVGSISAEWLMRPSNTVEAMTPTNVSAKRSTKWGSAPINSVSVSKQTLFVQRGARKLRELMYYFDIDGYRATDLTELAEHITGTGVVDMTYQSIPIGVVWLVRNDGALLGCTYDRDMMQLRVGWHWHFLGGQSDLSGTPPVIESVATIPSPDGTKDDVWMVVRRFINGAPVRYIEYLTKIFEDIDTQPSAFFVDCGLTYNQPLFMGAPGVTRANPAVCTVVNHGLSTGNLILITGVRGMTELNGNWFKITVIDASTFSLADENGNPINSTGYTAWDGDGTVQKLVTTISGLSYLQGETISIYADSAVHPPQVVNSSGQITLEIPAAVVSVGYGYPSDAQLLRLEAGSRNGTSLGKTRRIHRTGLMLHRSQGLMMGTSFNALDTIQFRTQGVDPNTRCTSLFTGIATHEAGFDYDFDNQICLRVDSPLPCTLLAVMPQLETQDRS